MSNKAAAGSSGKKKLTAKEIKDKLTNDSLDLSVCSLEAVSIKELSVVDLSKVRKLNLSYNLIVTLPDDFIKLQLIRELDLSKNKLTSLPKNFGSLVNLKNLDLLGNELTTLPSSFCELKSLQWLDLKDNPLHEGLKKAAGDCFNEAQCKKCATNVVAYMKIVAADEERHRQLDLKKKREEQARKDAEEKEKSEQLREQKKIEREERRRNNEQRRQQKLDNPSSEADSNGHGPAVNGVNGVKNHADKKIKRKGQSSFIGTVFSAIKFVLLISLLAALLFFFFSNTCKGGHFTNIRGTLNEQKWLQPALTSIDTHICPTIARYRPLVRDLIKPIKLI